MSIDSATMRSAQQELTWAGNHAYRYARWHEPGTVDDLQDVVRRSSAVSVLGSRHCFNDIADTRRGEGDLISLQALPVEVDIDADRRVARVSAWATYGQVGAQLHAAGWALPNTASLPHISIAGAIATGSHGSGVANRGLAAAVVAVDYLDAAGQARMFDASDPDFLGRVVALGALGVWTRVHLAVEPTFDIAQQVRVDLPFDEVLADLDAVTSAAYSVSLFTDYTGPTIAQAWLKARADQPAPQLSLGRATDITHHMLAGADAAGVTPQLGVPGPWHERLPHFQLGFTPSRGQELQSEYLVPRDVAPEAIERLRGLGSAMAPVLQVGEIRTIAADDFWLSPAHDVDVVGLHFTWTMDRPRVDAVLDLVEAALLPLGARVHWGKVFRAGADQLGEGYPRLGEFRALCQRADPEGVFRNDFLARAVGLEQ